MKKLREEPLMYGVIMAGGRGTRFWPRSRTATPKQLLDIIGEKTMIQETVERISSLIPRERIIIVTGRECADGVQQQLPDIPKENILIEPVGRNTAPCICLAALWIQRRQPEATMVVLPADHYIGDKKTFCNCIEAACEAAQKNDSLVTIGITPNCPETGYGYIQYGDEVGHYHGRGVYRVKKFHEKPQLEKACEFLQGTFLWNSGIFVWKAATILEEIKTFLPDIYKVFLPVASSIGTAQFEQVLAAAYDSIEAISIDYGVMEKSVKVLTLRGEFSWNDVGSWSAIYDISAKDEQKNVVRGKVVAIDAERIVAYSPKKLTAIIGLKDVIVVDSEDALLICAKDRAQDVKKMVELLEEKGMKEYL